MTKRTGFLLLLALAATFVGCGKKATAPEKEPLVTELRLTDSLGTPTRTFHQGEDIFISFIVINQTGKTLTWENIPLGPSVVFEMFFKDSLLASSTDLQYVLGMVYLAILKDSVSFPAFGLGSSDRIPKPVGNYTLRARPRLYFEGFGTLPDKRIDFRVVP